MVAIRGPVMTSRPTWLPEELRYADYKGDWNKFLEVVYGVFERDFKHSCPRYKGLPLAYDSKLEAGKEMAFWHLIQRHDCRAQDRVPDLRRCERIPWPKPIIQHPTDKAISVWKKELHRQTRIHIWLHDLDYIVVLAEMPNVMVLVTAFCTDIKSYRRKLIKDRDHYLEMQKPPCGTA